MPFTRPSKLDVALANAKETCPTEHRAKFDTLVASMRVGKKSEEAIITALGVALEKGLNTGVWN